jgi:TonB family protein
VSVQVKDMIEVWKQWEGEVINGEFHLRQFLGGSDHSAVFLTERGQGNPPQKAAIKLVPADPYNADRQLSRWTVAAKLSHAHLLGLFQMGRCQIGDRRLLYLVMEYAQEDLAQVLPHRAITGAELEEMLPPLVDTLTFLHGKSFVHGQVKPSNIMAVDDRLRLSSDSLRAAGEPFLGPRKRSVYDPPEIIDGNVSAAGDVWSLGVTLVQALTQQLPAWNGTQEDALVLPQAMPPQYIDLVRRCLCRDPSRRWTIAEIAARLKSGFSVAPDRIPAARQNASTSRRYIVPIAALVIAGLIIAGIKLNSRRSEPQQISSAAPTPQHSESQPDQTAIVPKSREAASVANKGKVSHPPNHAVPLESASQAKTLTGPMVKGAVIDQVLPKVPQSASDTITGTVRVRVRVAVDATGNVTDAALDSAGPSKYFANLAMQTARRWKFKPPQKDGKDVASEWLLSFGFKKTSNTVSPVQVTP